jgi:putative isomerase
MFDLAKVPFSRRGSYLSVSINDWGILGTGLYVTTHYDGGTQAFKLEVLRGEEAVAYEVEATPSLLTLRAEGGGEIQFVCDGSESLRVRGRGLSLRLEMPKERWTTAYEMPGGAWAVNMSKHGVQVALDMLAGTMAIDTQWERGKGFCWESSRFIATMQPEADGGFEAAVDNFLSTWVRPERPAFDTIRAEVEAEYAEWTGGLPTAPPEYETARDLAAYVNWSACVEPAGFLTRETMLMSKIGMCNVYGWDHAFNAMAHCSHQPDLAWDQLMVMADHQDEFGKCPTNMNRSHIRTAISNAPVQGWALRRMWDENPAMFTPDRLAEAYVYLAAWSNWITTHRTWPGDRLPYYQHGFDGGWDNSSIFDQGVPVISPDQPAYLILQMEVLADLAKALGREEEAAAWTARAKEMLTALIEDLWREDHFVGLLRPSGKIVECQSLVTCMPMVLGKRLPANVIEGLLKRLGEHLTPHGLATEKLDSPNYLDGGYWRGPIWAPSTMLVTHGLTEIGEHDLAHTIMQGFCRMCAAHGFYENFSATTGEGHYDTAYTWTSSVFMIFAHELHEAQA